MKCEICDKEFTERHYREDSGFENCCSSECYTHKYWDLIVEEKDKHIIANGCSYCVAPDDRPGMKGYGGREFHLKNLETGWITVTRNLWCQGDIPESHRNLLPDTHEFVSGDVEVIYDYL